MKKKEIAKKLGHKWIEGKFASKEAKTKLNGLKSLAAKESKDNEAFTKRFGTFEDRIKNWKK